MAFQRQPRDIRNQRDRGRYEEFLYSDDLYGLLRELLDREIVEALDVVMAEEDSPNMWIPLERILMWDLAEEFLRSGNTIAFLQGPRAFCRRLNRVTAGDVQLINDMLRMNLSDVST